MNLTVYHLILALVVGILAGVFLRKTNNEGFENLRSGPGECRSCGNGNPCGCPNPRPVCPPCEPCKQPDLSAYVLKSTIPPCPQCPDMSQYMLKTECPPIPDMSEYVLKSSIPKQQPVILDCSKCNKPKGECPPCPRARCPEVVCPEPAKCPACAPCPRQTCPPAVVKCKAEEVTPGTVRPFLAPLSFQGFGLA